MSNEHFPKGLDGRMRDQNRRIREKRGDTLLGTLRETYGEGFGAGRRADMRLDNFLDEKGRSSLSDYLKRGED